jgi:DNA-binding transcriptional ArsR family regulator
MNALSDDRRVRILRLLNNKIMCVSEIQKELRLNQPETSKQLGVLKDAKLIHSFRFKYGGYRRAVFYYFGKAKYVPRKIAAQKGKFDACRLFIPYRSAKNIGHISPRIGKDVIGLFEADLWESYLLTINDDWNYASELLGLLRPHLDF